MSGAERGTVEVVLADLAQRRRTVTSAIVTLAAFYGLDATPWLVDDTKAAALETPAPIAETKPARGETKSRIRDTAKGNGRGRPTRPTGAPTETQERILAALKAAREPVRPGALAKALKMPSANLTYHTKQMLALGLVKAEGRSASRRLSLAS